MPVNQMQGLLQDIPETISQMPAERPSDYQDILARLNGIPTVVDQSNRADERRHGARLDAPENHHARGARTSGEPDRRRSAGEPAAGGLQELSR